MSPHSNTLSWFQSNQSLLILLNAVRLAEKKQTQFYSPFDPSRELESTIYRTRVVHANYITLDTVCLLFMGHVSIEIKY